MKIDKSDIDKEKDFEYFGYETKEQCCVCGAKPSRIEPRFGYAVCKEHQYTPPNEINKNK